VRNNANSHHLLAVVAAVHHERVGETLNDGAVGLAEALGSITTGRVRDVDGGTDLNVVAARKPKLAVHVLRLAPAFPEVVDNFEGHRSQVGMASYVREISRISTSS
jgi:hypothetical protein